MGTYAPSALTQEEIDGFYDLLDKLVEASVTRPSPSQRAHFNERGVKPVGWYGDDGKLDPRSRAELYRQELILAESVQENMFLQHEVASARPLVDAICLYAPEERCLQDFVALLIGA